MVAPAMVLALRGVQLVLTIVVLGLSAYLVDAYTSPVGSWSPHSLNFMLFTTVWTLLALAYLVLTPTRYPRAAHKFAIAGVEALTCLFWFAAWVAVAALWGHYYRGSWGGWHRGTFYGCGVAAIVFGAFIWLSFVATTILSVLHIRRTPRNDTAPPPDMAGV